MNFGSFILTDGDFVWRTVYFDNPLACPLFIPSWLTFIVKKITTIILDFVRSWKIVSLI